MTFFHVAVRGLDVCDPLPCWRTATGGRLRVCTVPGDHFSCIRGTNLPTLGRLLRERLP